MKKYLALLIALVMVVALCACGQQQAAPATTSDGGDSGSSTQNVVSDFGQDASAGNANATVTEKPDGIQPGTEFSFWTNYDVPLYAPWMDNRASAFLWQVYDNLVMRYHSDVNDIRPCLAESWEVSDDQMHYVFHLRQDAYFTDGEQVTAQAFVATWDKATREYQPRGFTNVDWYKAVDDFTLEIQLVAPQASFMNELVCSPHYGPVSLGALEKWDPDNISNDCAVGVGPYVVESYTPGEGFVLKANTNYYNEAKQPSIETVRMVLITEENTALLALQNGEMDCMKFQSAETYDILTSSGWDVLTVPDRAWPFWMNARENPIFQDAAVREALCHMIDWNEVNELAHNGLYTVIDSYWGGAGSYPYDDSYSYDPELGLQILADAGYKPEDIKFDIMVDPDFTAEDTVVCQMLNDLGLVNVTATPLDGAACYGKLKAGTFEVFPCHNGYSEESCLTPYTMGLAGSDDPNLGSQPVVFLKWMNEEAFEEALEYYKKAVVSGSFEEYVENVSQITRICQENHVAFGGLCQSTFYAINPEISGVYPCQIGGYIEFCYLYSNVG